MWSFEMTINVKQQLPFLISKLLAIAIFLKDQMSYQIAQKLHALAHVVFQHIASKMFFFLQRNGQSTNLFFVFVSIFR